MRKRKHRQRIYGSELYQKKLDFSIYIRISIILYTLYIVQWLNLYTVQVQLVHCTGVQVPLLH